MSTIKHTFVICAYQESTYLEDCVKSLYNQTVSSKLLMVTSTPNEFIKDIADKYEIELRINSGKKGIVNDWNFAYSQADTQYITIAHQDDVYAKTYTEIMIKEMERAEKPLIGFTDYAEIRENQIIKNIPC